MSYNKSMRLRNDPLAKTKLAQHPEYVISAPAQEKINFKQCFNNDNDIYLEIGMGKGDFIINQAMNNPHINFIGLEKNITICAKALQKLLKLDKSLKNLKLLNADANDIKAMFETKSIAKLYLNFSDPWPKKRHAKNRLTHHSFLTLYKGMLKPHSLIEFKSDNAILYEYSLASIETFPHAQIVYTTYDLYKELNHELNVNNVPTEYEKRFCVTTSIKKIVFKL